MSLASIAALSTITAQTAGNVQTARGNVAIMKQTTDAITQAAERNAMVAEQQAGLAEKRGALAEEESRTRSKLALGTIRTRVGKSGVLLEGSPLESYLESVKQAELDALTKRYGGQLESFGFQQRAGAERLQAGLTKQQIRAQTRTERAKIPNILLSGAIRAFNPALFP